MSNPSNPYDVPAPPARPKAPDVPPAVVRPGRPTTRIGTERSGPPVDPSPGSGIANPRGGNDD